MTTTASKPPSAASAASSAAAKSSGRSRSHGAVPTDPAPRAAADLEIARAALELAGVAAEQEQRVAALGELPRERAAHALRRPEDDDLPHGGLRAGAPTGRCAACRSGSQMRAHALELVEARLHGAKVLGARERVLGQVDASALLDHALVERVDQRLGVVAHRDVERDRDPGPRERQHADALGAAVLDHAQERGAARARRAARGSAAPRPRPASSGSTHWYWVKPAPAVQPVPVPKHVERVEERLGVDDAPSLRARQVLPVEQRVERADAERPEHELRAARTGR